MVSVMKANGKMICLMVKVLQYSQMVPSMLVSSSMINLKVLENIQLGMEKLYTKEIFRMISRMVMVNKHIETITNIKEIFVIQSNKVKVK